MPPFATDPTGRQKQKGSTLIELMIVLVVLAVGIFAVARLFPLANRNLVRDRLRTEAVYYAQQKVETLRTLQVNDPDLAAGQHPVGSATETLGTTGRLKRYWSVTPLGAPLDNVLKVVVVVSWTDPTGIDSVKSTSYVNH